MCQIHSVGCCEILQALALSGRWLQVQTLATQFKVHKGAETLPTFARDMPIARLVTDNSGVFSEIMKVSQILLKFLFSYSYIEPGIFR